jgi:outer membrane protein OmpA-like peptidoglycan-associated protein
VLSIRIGTLFRLIWGNFMALRSILRSFVPALVLLASLGTSGCATGDLDQLNGVQPTGSEFTQNLFKDYAFIARSFGDVGTPSGATFDEEGSMSLSDLDSDVASLANDYAQKALDAANGVEVQPVPPPDDNAQSIRIRLMKALDDGRDRFPVDAARAQVDYDCMVMNARVPSLLKAAAQCARSLQATLAQLERDLRPIAPPAPAPTVAATSDYTVYFDFDSWTISGEALTVLQNAIDTARAGGQSRISIVGHTDTSGSAGYNQHLSQRRANVVKETLVNMGARREAITTTGVGEDDLAVQTGDGVKEPKNRRGIVTLVP